MRARSEPQKTAAWRHEERSLAIDQQAKLAVVADTHSRPHPELGRWLRELAPLAILHAGDVGDRGVLDRLAEVAPVIAVRGNIDPHEHGPDSVGLTLTRGGEAALRILLTHIAVRGPRLTREALALAKEHAAQVVICGHSHVPLVGEDRGLLVLNPGSVGPRRFLLPIVFGILEITDRLSFRHVDCETGSPWNP